MFYLRIKSKRRAIYSIEPKIFQLSALIRCPNQIKYVAQYYERDVQLVLEGFITVIQGEFDFVLQSYCCSSIRSFPGCADIHVSVDGNFHHKHLTSAGKGPNVYNPEFFIPDSAVKAVARRLARARKRDPAEYVQVVPDVALDACQTSFKAAQENEDELSGRYDIGGLMIMSCRHSIPLFLAHITTPGERQEYPVALIEHLFSLISPQATVCVSYDVGCTLDRTLRRLVCLFCVIIAHSLTYV